MTPPSADNMEANRRVEDNELQKAEKKAVMWALGIVAGTTTFLLAIIIAFLTGWFTGVLIFGGIPAVLLTFAILHLHLQDNEQRRLALAQDRAATEQTRGRGTSNASSSPARLFTISSDVAALHQHQIQLSNYFQQPPHCQHCQHCHGSRSVAVPFDGAATDALPATCREGVPPPAYDSLFPTDADGPSLPQENKQGDGVMRT